MAARGVASSATSGGVDKCHQVNKLWSYPTQTIQHAQPKETQSNYQKYLAMVGNLSFGKPKISSLVKIDVKY